MTPSAIESMLHCAGFEVRERFVSAFTCTFRCRPVALRFCCRRPGPGARRSAVIARSATSGGRRTRSALFAREWICPRGRSGATSGGVRPRSVRRRDCRGEATNPARRASRKTRRRRRPRRRPRSPPPEAGERAHRSPAQGGLTGVIRGSVSLEPPDQQDGLVATSAVVTVNVAVKVRQSPLCVRRRDGLLTLPTRRFQ